MERASKRRVVITGMGMVTPLGIGVQTNWDAMQAGRSGIGPITRFGGVEAFSTRIAGQVPNFHGADFIEPKELKKMDLFIQYALAAAAMAVEDSGFSVDDAEAPRAGSIVGVGFCGISTIEHYYGIYLEHGPRKISPFFVPKSISNLAPGQIAIRYGLKGVNWTPTSACASGNNAIGEAYRLIRDGLQDAVVAGGAEAATTPLAVGGFAAMKALSTRNDDPERASRPFDKDRDGFVIAEGAGILVLEERGRAIGRNAPIYAEVLGYATNGDAYHITSPAPGGEGAARCMALTLSDAGLTVEDIDYINAHGTSTGYNDANETMAIKSVFGERDGASSWSSRSGRSHLFHACAQTRHVAADHQLRNARSRVRPGLHPEQAAQNGCQDCSFEFVWIWRHQCLHHPGEGFMNQRQPLSVILGTGSAVPNKIMTNYDLEKIVETSDEWITTRTGIKERRVLEEATSDLALEACQKALDDAGLNIADIQAIIVGTCTPDYLFPSMACVLEGKLGARGVFSFDVNAACSGFLNALSIADSFIRTRRVEHVLVVGSDVLSRFLNWKDRSTCVLFGDAAGAVVLGASEEPRRGILSVRLATDGSYAETLYIRAGGSKWPASHQTVENSEHSIVMNGKEVFKVAVRSMEEISRRVLDEAGVTIDELSCVVPHQANRRIIVALASRLGIPMDKVAVNVNKYGNTSAASVPVALDEIRRAGRIGPDDVILLNAFGAGFAWGASVIRL
jgi:3-oxoacyl-[acyl-carrier-protein] synthase II